MSRKCICGAIVIHFWCVFPEQKRSQDHTLAKTFFQRLNCCTPEPIKRVLNEQEMHLRCNRDSFLVRFSRTKTITRPYTGQNIFSTAELLYSWTYKTHTKCLLATVLCSSSVIFVVAVGGSIINLRSARLFFYCLELWKYNLPKKQCRD